MKMDDEKKASIEAGLEELKAAFRAVARGEGFRVKGNHAVRRRNGAQQGMFMYRSRFGPVWIFKVSARIDRQGDKGEEILKRTDVEVAIDGFAEEDYSDLMNATALDRPAPEAGRGPVLQRCIRRTLPWLDEVSNRESLERMIRDEEYRKRMKSMVRLPFYEDFGIPLRKPSS